MCCAWWTENAGRQCVVFWATHSAGSLGSWNGTDRATLGSHFNTRAGKPSRLLPWRLETQAWNRQMGTDPSLCRRWALYCATAGARRSPWLLHSARNQWGVSVLLLYSMELPAVLDHTIGLYNLSVFSMQPLTCRTNMIGCRFNGVTLKRYLTGRHWVVQTSDWLNIQQEEIGEVWQFLCFF